jgi:hypothetical protein
MTILFLIINSIYKKQKKEKNIIKIIEKGNIDNIKKDSTEKIKKFISDRETNSSSWIRDGNSTILNGNKFPKVDFELKEISLWPEKTNIRCHNCSRNFDNPPIGIPTKYKDEIFHLSGCFCSFKCAKTYIHYKSFKNSKWESESLLYLLYEKMGNSGKIGFSPPYELMKCYGGPLTSSEYGRLVHCKILINVKNIYLISLTPKFDPFFLTDDDIIYNKINSCKYISENSDNLYKTNPSKKRVFRKNPINKNNKIDKIFKRKL